MLTKALGQHFLISEKVISKIVTQVSENSVLEVGPGAGALTSYLSEEKQVIAIEKDSRMVEVLKETSPKAEVLQADALKFDLSDVLGRLPEPRAIVSNMPYNITGPLLDVFTRQRKCVSQMVLMMQKEVGDKILAQPGERERGALSVVMQSLFDVSVVCVVAPGAFLPPPKVDSVVLRFVPREVDTVEEIHVFVRLGFGMPRKTLANNLKKQYPGANEMIERAELPLLVRPHELTWEDWKRLYECRNKSEDI